jgi:copper(I)-binding protein
MPAPHSLGRAAASLLLLLVLSSCGSNVLDERKQNGEARVGPVRVSDVHIVRGPGSGPTATIDFLLQSEDRDRDALVSVRTPAAGETELLLDGRAVPQVLVLPRDTVTRGIQARLLQLREPLERGKRVPVTFRFQRAGEVTVQAPVR